MSIKYGAQVAGYEYTFYNQLHNRIFCEIPFHYLIYCNTKPTNEIFIRTNFPFFCNYVKNFCPVYFLYTYTYFMPNQNNSINVFNVVINK